MSERVEIQPMPEFPPDYRDDYVKAQLSRAVFYDREHLIADDQSKEVPPGAMLAPGWVCWAMTGQTRTTTTTTI